MTPQEFKSAVKHRLIDLDITQAEMIRRVREKTGMFLDTSYLHKLYTGEKRSARMLQAIMEILELPDK